MFCRARSPARIEHSTSACPLRIHAQVYDESDVLAVGHKSHSSMTAYRECDDAKRDQ